MTVEIKFTPRDPEPTFVSWTPESVYQGLLSRINVGIPPSADLALLQHLYSQAVDQSWQINQDLYV